MTDEILEKMKKGENPFSCVGECRFPSPQSNKTEIQKTKPIFVQLYFPVIFNSPFKWCAKFERSLEKNIPPTPAVVQGACQNLGNWPGDWIAFWLGDEGPPKQWNKKTEEGYVDSPQKGIACWNCDNWQYSSLNATEGRCVFSPPPASGVGTYDTVDDYWERNQFPVFSFGTCVWCSKWQRARHTVPEPAGGWDCPHIP